MSHQQTLRIVDGLGEGFDKKVLEWKSSSENKMELFVSEYIPTKYACVCDTVCVCVCVCVCVGGG